MYFHTSPTVYKELNCKHMQEQSHDLYTDYLLPVMWLDSHWVQRRLAKIEPSVILQASINTHLYQLLWQPSSEIVGPRFSSWFNLPELDNAWVRKHRCWFDVDVLVTCIGIVRAPRVLSFLLLKWSLKNRTFGISPFWKILMEIMS